MMLIAKWSHGRIPILILGRQFGDIKIWSYSITQIELLRVKSFDYQHETWKFCFLAISESQNSKAITVAEHWLNHNNSNLIFLVKQLSRNSCRFSLFSWLSLWRCCFWVLTHWTCNLPTFFFPPLFLFSTPRPLFSSLMPWTSSLPASHLVTCPLWDSWHCIEKTFTETCRTVLAVLSKLERTVGIFKLTEALMRVKLYFLKLPFQVVFFSGIWNWNIKTTILDRFGLWIWIL